MHIADGKSRALPDWGAIIVPVVFTLDQAIKAGILAADTLPAPLTASWHARGPAAVVISALVAAGLAAWIISRSSARRPAVYVMLGAGASNLFDSLRHGAVLNIITIDRLQLNIADILVVAGAVWLLKKRNK